MKIIPIISGKGGTGKTIVAINVANVIKELGHKVGIGDIDITGPSAMKYLGLKGRDAAVQDGMLIPYDWKGMQIMSPTLFFDSDDQPVLLKGKMRARIVQQFLDKVKWNVEYLVLDCPPGSTDEMNYLVRNRKSEIYGVFIVATPSDVAMTQVRKSLTLCTRLEVPILGIIANMTEYTCSACHHRESIFADGHDPIKMAADAFHVPITAKLPIIRNVEANPLYFSGILKTPIERLI